MKIQWIKKHGFVRRAIPADPPMLRETDFPVRVKFLHHNNAKGQRVYDGAMVVLSPAPGRRILAFSRCYSAGWACGDTFDKDRAVCIAAGRALSPSTDNALPASFVPEAVIQALIELAHAPADTMVEIAGLVKVAKPVADGAKAPNTEEYVWLPLPVTNLVARQGPKIASKADVLDAAIHVGHALEAAAADVANADYCRVLQNCMGKAIRVWSSQLVATQVTPPIPQQITDVTRILGKPPTPIGGLAPNA